MLPVVFPGGRRANPVKAVVQRSGRTVYRPEVLSLVTFSTDCDKGFPLMARNIRVLRALIKAFFRALGLDIVRLKNVPRETLAGLHHRPVRTVIDCGANEGQFAKYISRFFPEASCIASNPWKNRSKRLLPGPASKGGA